jgi:hypothetical protein
MEHTKEQFLRHLFVWLKETDGEAWGTAIGLAVPCCPLIMRTARDTFIPGRRKMVGLRETEGF